VKRGELYDVESDPWEHENHYEDPEYRDVRLDLSGRLIDFFANTVEPAIPGGEDIPAGTPAYDVWVRKWWEQDGSGPQTPLPHLGGPAGSEWEE
jgi:hypothetical protein